MEEVRPRDRDATRRRILDAAIRLFSELGYDQVTMRLLAAEAEANVALINRYFGSKRELFAEVLEQQGKFPGMLDKAHDDLPRHLAEFVAERLFAERDDNPVISAVNRTGASPEVQEILRERMITAILDPLAARLPGPDAHLRATVAAALIMGSGTVHRLLGPHHLEAGSRAAVVDHLTAVFATCLGTPN
ncbi:TetR/AcrR family transcriptional regulator [Sinosporangium siamense]|uniref:TetR family transcriptional regulator n=1 Tax=Sinosporangium siamense TaxID=1367973 RepID=A0A919RE36_9ACTN|nr:TetR/AcrR family transcriptional regulator [Sinosporangium siamense]GII92173.1 TetR family transcriptional regulator [Sinosporangium siamense]